MGRKRLVVHIGFPKTGSSALQAYFSGNAVDLAAAGIDYPYPEPPASIAAGACSGNVMQIMFRDGFITGYVAEQGTDQFRPAKVLSARADQIYGRIATLARSSTAQIVLFSGEVMAEGSPEHWQRFRKLSEEFDVHVVAFLRDPFDYLLSGWRQQAKNSLRLFGTGFEDHLRQVLRTRRSPIFDGFVRLKEGDLPYTLVNYDSVRDDIISAFFSAAGLSRPRKETLCIARDGYNESLTMSEAIVVTRAAAILRNHDFARSLVQFMLQRPDRRPSTGFYSRELHAQILETFGDTIGSMNEVVVGQKISTSLRDQPTTMPVVHQEDIDALLVMLRTASGLTDNETMWTSAPNSVVDRDDYYDQEGVPADFDPRAYLFLNPDVAQSGSDPRQHYVQHGQHELRRYKYS